ncbi:odorant receptor Or2 isoform X2 [Cephus cinctus]|nr:odorant receptor Or2 isoform X2 [Cephus cinctus]XP_015610250.1 odorant receptor Or2 isoform X2 [Cephus cinctus]XP_024935692.1 odorant receptor Or2 isoform X2 [Cephus cinctus]
MTTLLSTMAPLMSITSGSSRYLLAVYNKVLIERILEVNKQVWNCATKQQDYETLKNYGLRARALTAMLFGSASLTVVFFLATPILAITNEPMDFYSNSTGNFALRRALPLPSPFETFSSPYYELAYVAQGIATCYLGVAVSTVDALSTVLVIHGCAQFKLLNNRLLGIVRQDLQSASNYYGHDQRARFFKTSFRFHRSILEYCYTLEAVVSISNLISVLTCMCAISFCAVNIVRGGADLLKFLGLFMVFIMQMLFVCWPADYLSSESTNIAFAFYNCSWYNYEKSIGSSIQIAIARSQNPVALTAGKFVIMSLETFTSILSSAMSFFAVLKSI